MHADFMATHNMFMSNRQQLINSCIYKKDYKINSGKNIKDSFSHPSFETRQHYAENYDFNEKLIKKNALDTGCNDQKLINKIILHYDEIILN